MTNNMISAASFPPLQQTQGRGTHSLELGKKKQDVKGWATRLFQATDKLPGGTAGAVRYESMTGDLLSEAGHVQKASDYLGALQNLQASGNLSFNDQQVARELIRDLSSALGK